MTDASGACFVELRHLRYFVVVAEELNIGRAAERLHIVQPALSRQMQALESELEVALFDRLPRGIRLTHAGEQLALDARRILRDVADTADRVMRTGRGELGALTIGFVDTMSWGGIVPATMRALQRDHPGIALRTIATSSVEQQAAIRDGRLDAGFCFYCDPEDAAITGIPVLRDDIVLAVPAGSALAQRASVSLADLTDEPFVWFPRRSAPRFHEDLMAACRARGFTPHVAHYGESAISILGLVGAGLGIALQPKSTRYRKPESVTLVPIDDLDLAVTMDLAWRPDNNAPALSILVDVVRGLLDPDAQTAGSPALEIGQATY
jgi:DNA-binding transcriptional LysR family regulator